jgi:hypothetical protein
VNKSPTRLPGTPRKDSTHIVKLLSSVGRLLIERPAARDRRGQGDRSEALGPRPRIDTRVSRRVPSPRRPWAGRTSISSTYTAPSRTKAITTPTGRSSSPQATHTCPRPTSRTRSSRGNDTSSASSTSPRPEKIVSASSSISRRRDTSPGRARRIRYPSAHRSTIGPDAEPVTVVANHDRPGRLQLGRARRGLGRVGRGQELDVGAGHRRSPSVHHCLFWWSFSRSFHQSLLQPTRPHSTECLPHLTCPEPTGPERAEDGQSSPKQRRIGRR